MEFKVWIKSLDRMSHSQRDKLREELRGKAGIVEVITLIEQQLSDEFFYPIRMNTSLYRRDKVNMAQKRWNYRFYANVKFFQDAKAPCLRTR